MAETTTQKTGHIRIGTSGWVYPPWRGEFYPKGLPQHRELEHLSSQVNSLELNGSFYALQRPTSYQKWHDQTPADFVFAVKGGRFITHTKRLRDVTTPLANFFASGVLALADKLGPFLWQLPPTLSFDPDQLDAFFTELPRDTDAAADLATHHDERLDDRALTTTDRKRPLRHAVEVRHESFRSPEFLALLRSHGVAVVIADAAAKWPYLEEVTADFAYVRLHGATELYASGYTDAALDTWAKRIAGWRAEGIDTYAYFDNDKKIRAPHDAMALADRLTHLETQ
jgi:uncharacterized protein YecE (DUF72 family)